MAALLSCAFEEHSGRGKAERDAAAKLRRSSAEER